MAQKTSNNTIHDIARRLNVSSTTVWRAINNQPRISEDTRKRVMAEVDRLGYQPSLVAQNLSWGRTHTIGVVVPTISNPVHAALVRAVEQSAFDRDYSITLCDTDFNLDRQQRYLDQLIRRRVEGVLLVPYATGPANDDVAHLSLLLKAGISVVCMQQKLTSDCVSQVLPDNFGAARDMTRHLISLGHQRIAFVHAGIAPWQVSINERLTGYLTAMEEAGYAIDPKVIVEVGSFQSALSDSGEFHEDRVKKLLRSGNRPTAIFAPVDVLAIKVMSVAHGLGMRIPDDVAIVGFDNIQMSSYTDPALTTVQHPANAVGRNAAELLFQQLAGNSGSSEPTLERVPCELVIRRSCGATGGLPLMKNDLNAMRIGSIFTCILIAMFFTACGGVRADGDDIDFVGDVLPILQTHCFSCHGEKAQEGALRLDVRDAAMRGGDSGEAILVGRGDESLLVERITSKDPNLRMPQDAKPLEPNEIAQLKRWIDRGADWPDSVALPAVHWSLKPLTKPAVPNLEPKPKNPIDGFIRAKLAESKLQPSEAADRRTLLRRIYFDLIGLPPTPAEFASFINDSSADAYANVVDRLLASPLYGERWARHWIDVAHWAETHGNDQDRPRPNAWPYRDYLVESFNNDKPYARFVAEQVAGDALYPDDPQATVALGFLASGPWDESTLMSIQDDTEDRKVGQVLDRDDMVATVMSTFCSVTVHCARCHNHKFDPIAQTDYYALQAVFSGVERTERPFDASPANYANRQRLLKEKQSLQTASDEWFSQPSQQALAAQIETKFVAEGDAWRVVAPASFTAEHGSVGIPQPDGSLLMAGPRPEQDTYTYVFEGDFQGITGIQLEVLTDSSLPQKGPGRQDNGNLHLSEVAIASSLIDGSESTPHAIARAVADFNQDQWDINKAIDGKPETAWGIYPEVSKAHSAVFVLSEAIRRQGKSRITLQLKQLHGGGHLIGRPRISLTASENPVVLQAIAFDVSAAINTPRAERTKDQNVLLAKYFLTWQVDREFLSLPSPMFVYAAANKATSNGVPISPPAEPRRVHVLRRGDIRQPMEEAAPGTLSCIDGLPSRFTVEDPKDESQRRAALARWLSDQQNVLLWRSIVNRVWHYHFGRGIVDTPNDLGKMGGTPSHPELLDWLAVEFRDQGGSLKWLHKLIVTSDAYRQSSQSDPERAHVDGDNRLLWRMNATRLDAEAIRDTVLAISGKLDLAMGGPSVKQFIESPGIHVTPVVDYQNFDIDSPSQYRRSIYRFLFRTLPDPFMSAMDCPDASQWAPTRSESVTALQALAMLNNRFIVRQSEHTAARLSQLANDPAEQMRLLFQLSLGREPEADESRRWQDYASKHGLQNACRMMFNTNEFLFVR